MAPPKIAIVSDTMVVQGGAERLLEVLAEAFPQAPVYTVLYDPKRGPVSIGPRVRSSWLRHFPAGEKYVKALLPFFPSAIESFDLSEYDIIVSSSHQVAKNALRTADQLHVCYCHTPMRAIWERTHAEIRGMPGPVRPLLHGLFRRLRVWDFVASARVDQFVANSRVTQARIETHYRRQSLVVPPPIDTLKFIPSETGRREYYLVAARNVPYKRIDLAIAAAERLERKLVVVGEGTARLRSAHPLIECRGKVDEAEFVQLMQGARAFLAPQLEDFGMAMLEANACGVPVIAYGKGGALDSTIDGETGVLFGEQTLEAVIDAIKRFETISFDAAAIRRHAERFSKRRFIETIQQLVFDLYRKKHDSAISHRSAHELMASAL